MNTPHQVPPIDVTPGKAPGSELAHLLAGLERQKEELGPIADELIGLLHHLGVDLPPRGDKRLNPSSE
ncbi:MAG: hypothetical protein FD187_1673 [bacterium]|jgi:hypothetical protein|nr:MAG: hypothetical protein FD142_2039 [bacterium]KAF0148878.1 MAG: hypothetical protein FD187_1673 [bacterium]KAF0168279.1 MAG: hypothetical protein FD158_1510 [bacterium]TXT20308.1 MAG: hypothetical protein FD132_1351 [bacterium]